MKKPNGTTLRVSGDTKDRLSQLKDHPNQSYDEIITQILNEREG